MDFRLNDDQVALRETVRDYLAGTHGPEVLRRLDAGEARDAMLWRGFADMGLTGLLVPEDQGGLGLGLVEAALVATECGRACVAEPLVDTALVAVPWLSRRGETDRFAAIAAGDLQLPVPHAVNPWVADGQGERMESVDPLRRLGTAPADAPDDPDLLDLAALMAAAQLVGVSEAMLAQSVDYAKLRTQFGQAVGAFQAVKHQLADVALAVEFAKPVLLRAAQALANRTGSAAVHVSHAKVVAGDAALLAAETAIQVHGAMGYTYEVDLHYWMKRAWALIGAWGDRAYHLHRIDDAVLGGALPCGPDNSFA